MSLKLLRLFVLTLGAILIFGCSMNTDNPVLDSINQNPPADSFSSHITNEQGCIALLGAYNLILSSDIKTAEITPMKNSAIGESYTINGTVYFIAAPCADCLEIRNIGLNEDEDIIVGFSIKHPFKKGNPSEPPSSINRLDLDLFDVALLVKPSQTDPARYHKSNKFVYVNTILNNDGYTCELSNLLDDSSAIPFKIAYENYASNRFEMGTSQHDFEVIFPKNGLAFELYLTMGYGASATFETRLDPTYFVPEFNRKAAWKVNVTPPQGDDPPASGNTWDDLDFTTPFTVTIDIYDWNHGAEISYDYPDYANTDYIRASSDIESVTVEIPGMNNSLIEATTTDNQTNGWDDPITYTALIANENGLSAGEYTGLVAVNDSRNPGYGNGSDTLVSTYDGKNLEFYQIPSFATYQTFPATVIQGFVDPINPAIVGRYQTFGAPARIDIEDNYAFVGTSGSVNSDIVIFDINEPTEPELIGRIESVGIFNYEVQDDYLFGLYEDDHYTYGIKVIDVSDKSNPQVFSTYEFSNIWMVWGIDVSGDYAYVGCYDDGLKIFDISDPSSILMTGTLSGPAIVYDVEVKGDYAFVTADETLIVVDVSDRFNPSFVTFVSVPCLTVRLHGNYAYTTHYISGFNIIEISDPENPVRKGSIGGWMVGDAIAPGDEYVYTTCESDGFKVIDVRNPDLPQIVKTCYTAEAFDAAINNFYLYVCDTWGGLKVYDINYPNNPVLAHESKAYNPGKLDANSEYIFTCERFAGLSIIDRSNPINPEDIGYLTDRTAYCVLVDGDHVFLGSYDCLKIFNVSNISTPVELCSLSLDSSPYEMVKKDNLVYAVKYDNGFDIIDVTSLGSPSIAGSFTAEDPIDIAVNGDYAYLADYVSSDTYLKVIDVSNPASPTQINEQEFSRLYAVETQGDYAYLTVSSEGLIIYDISDPYNLQEMGTYSCYMVIRDIEVSGDYAYLPHNDEGLHVVDITDPMNPGFYSSLNTDIRIEYIQKSNNYMFATGYSDGLTIIKLW